MGLKMESTVRTDASGVNFFAPCTNAMYMLELGDEEQKKLLDAAEGLGYEQIIVDKQMTLDSEGLDFLGRMCLWCRMEGRLPTVRLSEP